MRRFSFGEEEDDDEDMIPRMPEEFIAMTQFGSPDVDLLGMAIKVCERSPFWGFKKTSSKISMITEVFIAFKNLTKAADFEE